MGDASKQAGVANVVGSSIKKDQTHQSETTTVATVPICKLSPRHNGSTLYDSFELRAVTHQINRAIQGSKASPSSLYMYCFNSPLYRQHLDHTRKPIVKAQKRVSCTQVSTSCHGKPSAGPAKGLVSRAWNKVKQGLARNKQRNMRRFIISSQHLSTLIKLFEVCRS